MRPDDFSIARTHLLARPCGSMHRGHRRPWSTMMPFSAENSSLGRPQMFHCRILTGSPSTDSRRKCGLHGTPCCWHDVTQDPMASARYTAVKGPRYAICAAASSTSPVSCTNCSPSAAALAVHRVFSPPRPAMSFSARASLTLHMCTSCSSLSFLAFFSCRSASSAASLSMTTLSSACLAASADITTSSSDSASPSFLRLGSTTLATRSYASMARTQQQRP
mmetsp:Transcript_5846/g.17898  ORF Transcript_5846/g.17898 Transcript_5846/m.17898 type:complete len:221 (+) Transcript_5846:253-915(+)